ncbi:sensor histidine kinase [Plantactinospora solaniradicis]|uniref:Oxygen sensor histidine kinase NreB n=1 Tax=Plantactinospora solaniradicis TaxID=1723736 RepID=A0ABW1KKI1_9ACTN
MSEHVPVPGQVGRAAAEAIRRTAVVPAQPAHSGVPPSDPGSGTDHAETSDWQARYRFWDAYFGLVVLAVAGFTVASDPQPMPQRLAVLLPLAGLTGWYVGYGRRLMRDEVEDWRGYGYLAGAFLLYVPAVLLNGSASFVLFALCPQAYMLAGPVPATVAVIVFNSVHLTVLLARGVDPVEVATHPLPIAALVVVFSATFGSWIQRVVAQSAERARLIRELDRSRSEVARLSHEAGILAERQRLAGEIHDTIAQGLTSVVLLVQAADADLDGDPERAHGHLALAARTAREKLAEARDLIAALTPAALTESSLTDALARLVTRFGAETGLAAEFHRDGTPVPLTTRTEVVLLRAAQESLTNVRKHADAGSVTVRLAFNPETVVLEVTDDGRGLTEPATAGPSPSHGYGLTAMRARVDQVSGVLTLGPAVPGAATGPGTTVRIAVPI